MAGRAIDELARHFTDGAGRDETVLLIASHVLKIAQALSITPDPRLVSVVQTGEKALAKKETVVAATSLAEIAAMSWED